MKRFCFCIVCLCCISLSFSQDTLRLRVMTYNLRFGERASLEQLAEHIKAFNPDFVALQEVDVDTHRERAPHQNGKNFISELGYHTGMFSLYGKSINYRGGYYGIGILSKYPYIEMSKIMLPCPQQDKEQRVMLQAKFEINGKDTIVFASTHLDYFSAETRYMQVGAIREVLEQSIYPVILGGDFNARPDSKEIKNGMRTWKLLTDDQNTIPSHAPKYKIDYIFGYPKTRWSVFNSQAIHSLLSDHLPIISEIVLINK